MGPPVATPDGGAPEDDSKTAIRRAVPPATCYKARMARPVYSLVLRASLDGDVSRDVEILETATLHELARAIVACFDFDFDHAYGFYDKLSGNIYDSRTRFEQFVGSAGTRENARSTKKAAIPDAFPRVGAKMRFLYDYGDEWIFLVELLARRPKHPEVKLPLLVDSKGEAPLQYGDE